MLLLVILWWLLALVTVLLLCAYAYWGFLGIVQYVDAIRIRCFIYDWNHPGYTLESATLVYRRLLPLMYIIKRRQKAEYFPQYRVIHAKPAIGIYRSVDVLAEWRPILVLDESWGKDGFYVDLQIQPRDVTQIRMALEELLDVKLSPCCLENRAEERQFGYKCCPAVV